MKIIFKSDGPCHGELIFDTDWTFAKKILDIIWEELTINTLKTE